MEAIASACNKFYWGIFTSEIQQMSARELLDKAWGQTALRLFSQAKSKIQRGEAFLLRVGRHSGAESVTVSGARNGNIPIMKGKGQQPDFADAAKTLWLAADTKDQQTGLLPFGWLLVEVQPFDVPEQNWPELQALCEPHLQQARTFAARLAKQRKHMEQAQAEVEAKRRIEEEQASKNAEEEARTLREEIERKARLAAMTPEMRAVEQFRVYYQEQKNRGKYQPGSQFDEKRRAFFKDALEWTDAEAKRSAAALIRESIKDWSNWPSKAERKAEFRSWLERLEQ